MQRPVLHLPGPRYNPTSRNGLPVLGVWEPPAERMPEDGEPSFVPPPGLVVCTGLTATEEGIHFQNTGATDDTAKLFQEDFLAAMALAFSPESAEPVWPWLSPAGEFPVDFSIHPSWLGATRYGQSLYSAHQLLNVLATTPHDFEIGEPIAAFHPQVPAVAHDCIVTLKDAVDHSPASGPLTFRIQDYSVDAVPTTREGLRALQINVTNVRFHVLPAGGAVADTLTNQIDLLTGLMPVFLRVRQLSILTCSLSNLREQGYELPCELKANVEAFRKSCDQLLGL